MQEFDISDGARNVWGGPEFNAEKSFGARNVIRSPKCHSKPETKIEAQSIRLPTKIFDKMSFKARNIIRSPNCHLEPAKTSFPAPP